MQTFSNILSKSYFSAQRIASKPAGNADRFNVMQAGEISALEELRAKQLADAQFVADSMELGQLNLAQPGSGVIFIPVVFYFHPDHLGSSTLITDNFGEPYQFFLNLPFGETFAEQRRSGSFDNPYKFNGKELDEETGMYYYGARYYNPRTSVFISVDPLTEQTMTPYQYTYQNPVRYIDPDGKAPQDIIVLNVDGSIRKVYNDGSPHITIIDPNYKGRFTLSSYRIDKGFIYRNNRNRQIIANIAAYYGQQIGVSGVGATSKGKGIAHFDPSDNGIWILPQSNGSPSSQLNNKYNMQNVLIHENFHKKNEKDGINETFLTHAQVVLKASEHSTFKNTTTDYKEGQIGYMSQLLMNAYYQNKEKEDVQSVIDHFNNLNIGYKLKFYRNDQTIYITTPQGDYKHIKYKRSNSSPNLD